VSSSFSDLGVPARLVTRLAKQGIANPFPIQTATIPDALAGRDVCGRAPTGSGKTIAFGIAVVGAATGSLPRRPRALVLVPTRELASQVQGEIALLAEHRDRIIAVYGGTAYGATRRALEHGVDIVVACPGRLEDLLKQGALKLNDVKTVVLDEADRMADMGFLPAVRRILDQTSPQRQVLLFSATIGREVEAIIDRYQRDPVRHDVSADESSVGEVAHLFWRAERSERVRLTARLVSQHGRAVIFCRTKRGADRSPGSSARQASPPWPSTATAPSPSASGPLRPSPTDAPMPWWPPTWPPAASTSRTCPASCISTLRRMRPTTSTVLGAQVEPASPARSCRW